MNKKILIPLVGILLLSGIAGAQEIDTRGLTEEQRAQLALQAAQMKAQAKEQPQEESLLPPSLDPKELNEWVDLGKNVGLAIAATAKELGVASDEFLKSTTGKITVVLIVWKLMGEDVIGVVGGTAAWLAITAIILWSFQFFHMSKRVVNKTTGEVSYVQRYEFQSGDSRIASTVAHAAGFALMTIICMTIIF